MLLQDSVIDYQPADTPDGKAGLTWWVIVNQAGEELIYATVPHQHWAAEIVKGLRLLREERS